MSVIELIREDLRKFNPYSSARDEAKQGKIWLNANESPFVRQTKEGVSINRYPEKQPSYLLKKISKYFGVDQDQIMISRGSDEGIDLLTRLFCRAEKDKIMICPPTFGMYSVCAQLQGADIISVPLKKEDNFNLDLDVMMASWTPEVKIIFLCSPNNPTGNVIKENDVLFLCETLSKKAIIVVDEAYIEFSSTESLSQYINKFSNLVILRTFSKAYGLAGSRSGLLFAQAELIRWLKSIMAPYPLPIQTVKMLEDVLNDNAIADIKKQITVIKNEREKLIKELGKIKIIEKIWPTETNYVLTKTRDSKRIMDICNENGIVLRNMNDKPGLNNCIRISIGLPEENNMLIDLLKRIVL